MNKLNYNIKQRKRASTLLALATTEIEAASKLNESDLYRESVIHLYFGSYYISQAFMLDRLKGDKHKAVESQLHYKYGRSKEFPRIHVRSHSELHCLRNEISYHSAHSPEPTKIVRYLKNLEKYYKLAKKVIPEISYDDILLDIYNDNPMDIKDFSIDIYCPRTYKHHTRITVWFPPFYLNIFKCEKLAKYVKELLRKLKVKKCNEYVAGLNSKLDQYSDVHLLMFDIDSFDAEVEKTLKEMGGILLKSGRGFHFIGKEVIFGEREWRRKLRKTLHHKVLKNRIDKEHVEISLKRGYSTLRITASPLKTEPPRFFKEF